MFYEMQTVVYYSNRCPYSNSLLVAIDKVPDVAEGVVRKCVEEERFPREIRKVPAVVDNGTLYQGEDAFVWLQRKKETVPSPYAYSCYTGPSPTSMFSYLDSDVGYGHRQDAFEAFDEGNSSGGDNVQAPSSGVKPSSSALDALIAQRKSEIPQPISRQ